jgi:nucleoside-diphosphate-sugar epimerase
LRYVVTGGAGFIGSHLVERLVMDGSDVVVLDDFSTGKRENLAPWLDRIEIVEASVNDSRACKRALKGADFVLHQAARPSVARSIRDPVATHEINATGTLAVLLAAKDAGVRRFVYASSSSVYGDAAELPKRETRLPEPLSPYAAAKLAGEHYCRVFATSLGLETVALRYFNVYGPRQDPASEYAAVIPRFIVAALDGVSPEITGDGEQTRDFTHVRNVVEANLLACRAAGVTGSAFNVGGGRRISINELWVEIQRQTGSQVSARYVAARPGDVRDSLASLERSRQVLAYEPVVTLERGLADTIRSFRLRREQAVAR